MGKNGMHKNITLDIIMQNLRRLSKIRECLVLLLKLLMHWKLWQKWGMCQMCFFCGHLLTHLKVTLVYWC